MFAEVYPIAKLPKHCGVFDYRIPEHINVQSGDLVEITLRKKSCFGIVKSVKSRTNVKYTQEIAAIKQASFLSVHDIERYEWIASSIFQSVGNLLYFIFSTLPAQHTFTLSEGQDVRYTKQQVQLIKTVVSDTHKHVCVQGTNDLIPGIIYGLRKTHAKQILVICPNAFVAENLHAVIKDSALITGKSKKKHRQSIMHGWQSGDISILIGTKLASLLPAKQLSHVLMSEPSNDDYDHRPRNPRIQIPQATEVLARMHQAKMLYIDHAPSARNLMNKDFILSASIHAPLVVDMHTYESRSTIDYLSDTALEEIQSSLQKAKNVLILFNRVEKQEGSSMPSLKEFSALLHKAFPTHTLSIIEKTDSGELADITVATDALFSRTIKPLHTYNIGTIIDATFDFGLNGDHFSSLASSRHRLFKLISLGNRENARVIIQSWLPNYVHDLLDITTSLQQELQQAITYKLPPVEAYAIWIDENGEHQSPLTDQIIQQLVTLPDKFPITTYYPSYGDKNRITSSKSTTS